MLVLLAAAAVVIGTVRDAAACQICFNGQAVTIGQQLDAADQAVLAVPLSDGQEFQVVAVVKGDQATEGLIAQPVYRTDAMMTGGKPLLLLRNRLAQRWDRVGEIDIAFAGWLRQLAATYHGERAGSGPAWPRSTFSGSELTDAEWRARVALVAPYLENPQPLAADIAHGEISRAPYGALRSLKSKLVATAISRWIDDPSLAARHSTYLLLLGIAGGPDDAERMEQRVNAQWRSHDATDLAALLAAELELGGPQHVESIEKKYLVDRNRKLPEIEAALLALSVHGRADAAVPRTRVIAAYRLFMRERKPMAGFVAQELADWGHWDATMDYVAILKSNVVKDPSAHFMIVNYLRRSPDPAAKAALRSLAAGNR
jgi:hypothetical protein